MKKIALVILVSISFLVGCGASLSTADEACKAYRNGDYEMAYSKFSKLIRDNSEDSDYKKARSYLSFMMDYDRGEIDENGCDTNLNDSVNFCSGGSLTESETYLNDFCA